jgi:protein SCO1/2
MHKRALLVAASAALLMSGCKRQEPFEMLKAPAEQETELRKLWPLPDFKLTERNGKTVQLGDLAGKVWIADFFYTTCPGPCPMLSSRLTEIQGQLANEQDVRLVSISTDPEKDTPAVLELYADKFKAGERWLFLTGDKQAIYDLGNKGFKLSVSEDPGNTEPITHSTKLGLVDRAGVVRGFYEGVGEEGTARLIRDVRRLLKEAP